MTTIQILERLQKSEAFRSLDRSVLEAHSDFIQAEDFKSGDLIIRENESGDTVYVLCSGSVAVHRDGYTIASIEAVNIFGEMSILDSKPRSVSISALNDVQMVCIHREGMLRLMQSSPELMQSILHILAQRLREQNNAVVSELQSREAELRRQVEEQTRLYREQKEIAEEQRARAEQSEKFEQEFLANMSHEIRTPMNAVIGMTNLLLDKNPRQDQLRYLNGIRRASDILLVIINDILDLSKIEAGKMEIESVPFSVRDVVSLVVQTLHVKAEEKANQLHVDIEHDVPELVMGDPTRLNQIIVNLVGNAIKFTDHGTVQVRVRYGEELDLTVAQQFASLTDASSAMSHQLPRYLEFSVEDSGKGMNDEQLAKLFQSFQQASASIARTHGGTGLGLSISKQLVELQHGSIEASSTPGKGSTFSFRIPYHTANESISRTQHSTLGASVLQQLSSLHVLLVDDDEYNRVVATDTLELKLPGIQIHIAVDGIEALETFHRQRFDLILMDVNMPRMDGYECTRRIRSSSHALREIPIIALTASAVGKDVDKCLDAGMNAYVVKPFRSEELLSSMAQVLRHTGFLVDTPESSVAEPAALASEHSTQAHTLPELHEPAIDLSFLREFCEGDEVRMKKYLGMYLKNARALMDSLRSSAEAGQHSELKRFAHTLKSQFMYLGMKSARELALYIETESAASRVDASVYDAVNHLDLICAKSFEELEALS